MINSLIMNFSYDDLAVLVAAGESRSFREAAAALKISQASVTNRLQELGRAFSVPLLVTEGNKKVLSPFGRSVAGAAKDAFTRLKRDMGEAERRHGNAVAIPVRVGCRAEVFAFALRSLPREFAYQLVPLKSAEIAPALLDGQIDIGLSPLVPDSLHVLARPAFRSRAELVAHRSLVKKGKPLRWQSKDFLQSTPALAYREGGHLLGELCERLSLPYPSLQVKAVAESWATLAALAGAGHGYAVLPSYVATAPDVVRVELPADLRLEQSYSLLMRKAYKDVPAFRQILRAKWGTCRAHATPQPL
jgi:DNA-binding transcriptional LysR family regulator